MKEEIIYKELEKKVINKFISCDKGYDVCEELGFDETSFCLLLLDVYDKGLQRVKEILLKKYTQESNKSKKDNKDQIDLYPRELKPNISVEDKEDFFESIKILGFLNSKIAKKTLEYTTYLKNLPLNISSMADSKTYHTALKSNLIISEEEYLKLTSELNNQNAKTDLSEIIRGNGRGLEEDLQSNLSDLLSEFNFEKQNRDFYSTLSQELKELCLNQDKTESLAQETSVEDNPEQENISSAKSNENKKQQLIKLKMRINAIDYHTKMSTLIAKKASCSIQDKNSELQK